MNITFTYYRLVELYTYNFSQKLLIFSSNLAPGGAFKPKECLARTKLAVIVAFRDRDAHLKVFLHHMHPIFQRQLLEYRIFVVEQTPTEEFNRGALMNIGYTEAFKVDDFDCFAFHDVDLVPEDDRSVKGPTQVKCRLLISSIFYVMNFRHFLEMLEFNLWHF